MLTYSGRQIYLSGTLTVDYPEEIMLPPPGKSLETASLTGSSLKMTYHPLNLALQQLQHDHTLAVRDYQLAMGRRSSVAYRHGVTVSAAAVERNQAMLAYQQQWSEYEQRLRDKQYQLTQTQLKLDQVNHAISTLAVVRSPYAGRIRRVQWLGQKPDGSLGVELTLLVRDGSAPRTTLPGEQPVVPGAADGVGD